MKKIHLSIALVAVFATAGPLSAQSYVPEYADHTVRVAADVPIQAYPFDVKDVRLLDGPFKEAMEADAHYLLEIEPDRLLSEFRAHAGLEPKGKKYGGWESSGLAGHTLGHYLSACSLQYASTGDKRYLDRVNYIVGELAVCQSARSKPSQKGLASRSGNGLNAANSSSQAQANVTLPSAGGASSWTGALVSMSGYVGAIPREDTLWSEVSAGYIRSHGFDLNGAWSPWYTVHKVMAGLLDAYLYCGNAEALRVEKGMADWTGSIVGHLSDSTIQRMLVCEYGGMNDVLANTYALTGDKKYLALSYKFHDQRILDSLSRGLDDLSGKHSNTQIPKVIGCARRYELTGDAKDERIAESFWKIVVDDHTYANGGNSNYEYLGPPGKLNDQLTDNNTETCNTYNMLKLTRHLFAWHPTASLMDYYEKALYNHILASQDHDDGMMCYFVPLRMGGRKNYSDPFRTFTCCVGSGMENHVKYGESIYSRGKDGSLYVNLFIPSRLDWKEKGVTLEQQTQLPANDLVTLTVGVAAAAAHGAAVFALRIRQPHWASQGVTVMVNGIEQKNIHPGADGYLVINRGWKNNDKVEIRFPESFYTEAMPDNPARIALFYGPVLLAGELGDKEPDPVKGIPVLVAGDKDPNKWIKNDGNLVFQTAAVGQPGDVKLIPFNRTKKEYYSVYWDLFTPGTWAAQQARYSEERKMQQALEDRTVDRLRVGEMQPERDHSFAGEGLRTGEAHGQQWRATEDGGYFSFVMKVDSSTANTLICSYWGADHRGRIFNIQIDGQTIATQDLNSFKQSKFYEIKYPVPQELVKGKTTVVVKFASRSPHNGVGPVSGTIRMVKNDVN
ncbi:MAG TPA: beta-L-arabinofuranosidase domain-containing protein [Puia sp.]